MKQSKTQIALLMLSKEKDPITAKMFAHLIWPNSPAWNRSHNTGPNGATRGKGMWLAAGSFLRKLEIKGYVWSNIDKYGICTWGITKNGKEFAGIK